MTSDIFISYSRHDSKEANEIALQIKQRLHIDCWIDRNGIESGCEFSEVLIKAISDCKIFLFLYSENSAKSEWTRKELNFAQKKQKKIVMLKLNSLLRLDDWFEFSFGNLDYKSYQDKEQFEKLLKDIYKWINSNIIFEDGYYEGEILNGKPHNEGARYWNNGDSYVGYWENGLKSGFGTYKFSKGDTYIGEFKNDKPNGQGTYYFSNGKIYTGTFQNGRPARKSNTTSRFHQENKQKISYDNGYYEGNIKNNTKHGLGSYHWNDGTKYYGDWKNDIMEGAGTCFYSNGDKYSGNWKNNKKSGNGTYYYSNNEKFQGEWRNNRRHGYGTYYNSDGSIRIVGTWKDDKYEMT